MLSVSDGVVAEPAAAVGEGAVHHGVHPETQVHDGQTERESSFVIFFLRIFSKFPTGN